MRGLGEIDRGELQAGLRTERGRYAERELLVSADGGGVRQRLGEGKPRKQRRRGGSCRKKWVMRSLLPGFSHKILKIKSSTATSQTAGKCERGAITSIEHRASSIDHRASREKQVRLGRGPLTLSIRAGAQIWVGCPALEEAHRMDVTGSVAKVGRSSRDQHREEDVQREARPGNDAKRSVRPAHQR